MRKRTTWDTSAIAKKAALKVADPFTMNQSHPQPSSDAYDIGGPSDWAEDVAPSAQSWEAEYAADGVKREETGHGKFRDDTFKMASQQEQDEEEDEVGKDTIEAVKKAALCMTIAREILGKKASLRAVESQAQSLMSLTDSHLVGTFTRIAAQKQDDLEEDDSEDQEESQGQKKQAQDQCQDDESEGQKKQAQQQQVAQMQQQVAQLQAQLAQLMDQGQQEQQAQQMQQAQQQQVAQQGQQAQQQQVAQQMQQGQQEQQAQQQQQAQQMMQQAQQMMQQAQQMMGQQGQQAQQMQQAQDMDMMDLDMALRDDDASLDGMDIEMDQPEMGLDFVANEDAVRQLFASDEQQAEEEESKQGQAKQASLNPALRTVGTQPSGARSLPARTASSNSSGGGLESLWVSSPDISGIF
jgi:hypothetical protein